MKVIIGGAVSIIFLVLFSGYWIAYNKSVNQNVTIFVENKERLLKITDTGSGSSSDYTYAVYSENQIYQLHDALPVWHFSTYDIYNKLKVGKSCVVDEAGWRVPILSMTKNIIKVHECE